MIFRTWMCRDAPLQTTKVRQAVEGKLQEVRRFHRMKILPMCQIPTHFSSPLSQLLLNRYREEPSSAKGDLIIAHYLATFAPSFLPSRPAHKRHRPESLVGSCLPNPCWRAVCWGRREVARGEKVWYTPVIILTFDFADCINNNWI